MENEYEEILDRPVKMKPKRKGFRIFFYIASLLLILRFIFYYQHWPYSNYLLLGAGFFYVLFSILRLIYQPKKNLFQIYSYVFFTIVIPAFIMDYLYIPGGKIMLNIATAIPIIFFVHMFLQRLLAGNKAK